MADETPKTIEMELSRYQAEIILEALDRDILARDAVLVGFPEGALRARHQVKLEVAVLLRRRIDLKLRNLALIEGGAYVDTDREFSANFDRQASATDRVLFLGLSPPKVNKTVSFFVLFHRGAPQSGILFLVSIERGGSRRVYDRGAWLSDMSQLGDAPCRCLARPGGSARRVSSDRSAQPMILRPMPCR
jgi:hypothetical protein